LRFALQNARELKYLLGYEGPISELLEKHTVRFQNDQQAVEWTVVLGDFPGWVEANHAALPIPAPHAILFDPFSPAKNPAMWTPAVFTNLFRCLDPARPCALATYSRSTFVRATLLLAGFFVGVGHPTGEKEETTGAANSLDLLDEPLARTWLARTVRSGSAEPLWEGQYRQQKLADETLKRLEAHPQFSPAT
jgi:hypothetical protein